jgi:hypothetical protein
MTLPDLLTFNRGAAVRTAADWNARRREIWDAVIPLEYGGIPPAPGRAWGEVLHAATLRHFEGVRYVSCRVHCEPGGDARLPFSFMLYLTIPSGAGPFPVVLNGDACWRYASEAVTAEVIGRGYILAQFNRVELAPDMYNSDRASGLYRVYPQSEFGALAAWAWGYHRCVDVLLARADVDPARIAVVGHSRGGKTSLLAGATDERIALTSANDSGAGGAGCYRIQGPESETLADLLRAIPYWFGPHLKDYRGREAELPFDQHFVKALVAPRLLLTTEALGDLWANPTGTWQTHAAAAEVYRMLGAPQRTGVWYREGGHDHSLADWQALLDFADWHWRGLPPARAFDANPFA